MSTLEKMVEALAKADQNGLGDQQYDSDKLQEMMPEETLASLENAMYELKAEGLIDHHPVGRLWWFTLNQRFYERFDLEIMGLNHQADAVGLAQYILTNSENRSVKYLHEQSNNWPRRRFNPALQYVFDRISLGKSDQLQPDYPVSHIMLNGEHKIFLRRFVEQEAR